MYFLPALLLSALLISFLNSLTGQLVYANTPNYALSLNKKNFTLPVIQQRVDIVYFRDFKYKKKPDNFTTAECFPVYSTHSDFYSSTVFTLRCSEYAHLLLGVEQTKRWQKEQAKNGFIKVNFPEFGVNNARAEITAITPVFPNILKFTSTGINTVTGVFISHSTDVWQYQFVNEKTKSINKINVTANHRFYVSNRHIFIPVKEILSTDRLISSTGDTIRILCPADIKKPCGQPYLSEQPVQVYNLEVARQHIYHVGSNAILVHNPCNKREMRTEYYDERELTTKYIGAVDSITGMHDGYGQLHYISGYIKYKGSFSAGEFDGFGFLYYDNGVLEYAGPFKSGKKQGSGVQYWYKREGKPVKLYEGFFRKDKYSGRGTMYFDNGKISYVGRWAEGVRDGKGTAYSIKGEKLYDAEWVCGNRIKCSKMYNSPLDSIAEEIEHLALESK